MMDIDSPYRKGERKVLKWNISNFHPHLFGIPGREQLISPLFQIEGAAFRFCIVSSCSEFPDTVTCSLGRYDPKSELPVYYFTDLDIAINKHSWKYPESLISLKNGVAQLYPVLSLLTLKRDFPSPCELTVHFRLRKCIFKKLCPSRLSISTVIQVNTASYLLSFGKLYSYESQNALENDKGLFDASDDYVEIIEINAPTGKISPFTIRVQYYTILKSIEYMYQTKNDSEFVKHETYLLDFGKNSIKAAKKVQSLLSNLLLNFSFMHLPRDLTEEIERSPSVSETMGVYNTVSYHNTMYTEKIEASNSISKKSGFNLIGDLRNFYRNRIKRQDICVQAGENSFEAHRCILAARSPVFETMFQNYMLETRTGVIEIVEMNSDELGLLLSFIYSTELDKNMEYETAVSLYAAADKYGIPSLLKVCRRELKKNVSLNNLSELLLLSYLYRDTKLKDYLIGLFSTLYPTSAGFFYEVSKNMDQELSQNVIQLLKGMICISRQNM